ncbi:MAG: hypothetical protein WBF67_03980 [Olleya sp.]
MKTITSICIFVLVLTTIGCSTSKKTTVNRDNSLEDNTVSYHVKAKSIESDKYNILIDNKFQELESLDLPLVKIYYNKKDVTEVDCEIEIIFGNLTINDKDYSKNKHFSKVVKEEQAKDENDISPTISSNTIRGYSYQKIEERKLNWDINLRNIPDSNNCKLTNDTFTERIISKSINNILSGDERAIPKKYKVRFGQPLLSKEDMIEETINNVYQKIAYQLKKNH